MKPLALGYFRVRADDPPEIPTAHTEELRSFAESEGLTLADVYTDPFDPPSDHADRAGFCALMDALRREDAGTVIILAACHLSRAPGGYNARRAIIETEGGARLIGAHSQGRSPSRRR